MSTAATYEQLLQENEDLRWQLEEATDTITAIRTGQVDALVVQGKAGHELYTLRTADQTYRVFIEQMNEGALTLTGEGIILYSNSMFARMVGLPLSSITGQPLETFISTAFRDVYRQLFLSKGGADAKLEVTLQQGPGALPCQLSVTTLSVEAGITRSVIITDLSFQKQTEALLSANNAQLATTIAQLESSNHDLQQFASVASHDLQEPLRKIIIFSGMLKDRLGAASQQAGMAAGLANATLLDKIISASLRLRTMIADILSYSRLSDENQDMQVVNIGTLVQDVLQDYDLLIEEQQATITVCDLPEAQVSAGQLRQVFQNIISNALKFCRPGVAPVIAITCTEERSVNGRPDMLHITIADNGIGFSQEYAGRVFSLFQRLNNKDDFEGSGIGLAIAKKIMDKHHGAIRVESEEGVGSSFIISLPVRQAGAVG